MRKLIQFAIAFGVVFTEQDSEELGFDVSLETFKEYFEIPADANEKSGYKKTENFKVSDIAEWFNQAEKKATKDAIASEAASTPAASAAPAPKADAAAAKAAAKEAGDKAKADATAKKVADKPAADKKKADEKQAKIDAKNAEKNKDVELNQREQVYLVIRNEEAKGKNGLTGKPLMAALMYKNPTWNAGAIWAAFKHYNAKKQNAFDKEKILIEQGKAIVLPEFEVPPAKVDPSIAKAEKKAAADKVKAETDDETVSS